jgi:hypothetical protein
MLSLDRYLTAALGEWPKEHLGCAARSHSATVWRLRRSSYPRADRWARDAQQFAVPVVADAGLLRTLVWALGVQGWALI